MATKELFPQKGASLVIPCATVFISSFCIMVIELVAGRIIARFLGSSIYTWTSVIGVVLTGITIGNYLGGRIADAYRPRKSLALLFILASVACVITVVLNNLIGEWIWLWRFSWPVRVFLHVSLVFLLPSALLGTISPVVAKMALEKGFPPGRTVGDIYAWSAAGSIVGTFTAGYYLIALMGTIAIVWAIAAVMLLMAFLYGFKFIFVKGLALLILISFLLGLSPYDGTKKIGQAVRLRTKKLPEIIYEDETPYSYIMVSREKGTPEKRIFVQDTLVHSKIEMGNISALEYPYAQIMAAITRRFAGENKKPNFLFLGGGGYVLPRYLEKYWPQSSVTVVEIDKGVTKAAMAAFGLDPATKIKTINLDARNYVDYFIQQEKLGHGVEKYDFIYEDVVNDYSIPFQLTTKEYNDKIFNLLTGDGIYMVNMIDMLDSGLLVGSVANTLRQTFPYVAILTDTRTKPNIRNTFVAAAAKRKLNLTNVCRGFPIDPNLKILNESEIEQLQKRSNGLILTDNYAPVENLLAPVVKKNQEAARKSYEVYQAYKVVKKAHTYAWKGDLENTIRSIDEITKLDPAASVEAYQVMAKIFIKNQKYDLAARLYERAFEKIKDDRFNSQLAEMHYDYALLQQKINEKKEPVK